MMNKNYYNAIFKKGSKNFFYASLLFSPSAREKVSILYSFVRTFDDLVDKKIPNTELFFELKNIYYECLANSTLSRNLVIDGFVSLQKEFGFDQGWVDAFFSSMEADIKHKPYETLEELNNYMYGSAVVVGFMLCNIFKLDAKAYPYAQELAEAFQYINFIRDIDEDMSLGRSYLPAGHYKKFGFFSFDKDVFLSKPESFASYIRSEIEYFYKLIKSSEPGFRYLGLKVGLGVLTAKYLYEYIASVIYKRQSIVFEKKSKALLTLLFLFAQ